MKTIDRQKSFEGIDLRGKIVVFTGGTDGMGKAAVKKLAAKGATIFLLGRNKEKTIAVISELNEIAGKKNTNYVHCDLASQKSIREAAKLILERCEKIDLLINCAGIQPGADRKVTIDGFELNWAVNHLGPFLLTNLLLNKIKESAPARIVNLSSATEKNGHIHIDDLQLKDNWSMLKAYPQAKLAMNMCTRKMAKELTGTGVAINALNPGFIKTNLLNNGLKGWGKIAGALYMYIAASKPEIGGDRILRLALSKEFEGVSGKFIYEDVVRDPNPEALDNKIVEKIWAISKEQTNL
jgi:NAD(P)-dependent dehydrogenase (short-subunit alcohol dehydrogenase family)